MRSKIKIFCDFDGTISEIDIGNRLFHIFSNGASAAAVDKWRRGLIGSKQCFIEQCAALRVTREQILSFAETQRLEPSFLDFVEFCRTNHVPVIVLSDGLGLYIKLLFEKYGLSDLRYFANNIRFNKTRVYPEFPFSGRGCGNCGNCKGYHVRRLKMPGELAVFIGDGLSDLCAVPEADVIFAKGELLEYCREKTIAAIPFKDFNDIREKLARAYL